jgi:hypothetical protein
LIGEDTRGDEINFGFEGAFEAVLPAFEVGEDGEVLRLQSVSTGLEDVGELALVDEGGGL